MHNHKTVVKMIFGSHLYGTDTPGSDKDFKGVFLPTKEEIFLCNAPKSLNQNTKADSSQKNTNEDVDYESYSLQYFIHLACQGETAALDMLHAPDNMILERSDIWDTIVSNRAKFYTSNLRAFVGYARRQAAKYGVKGSRLNVIANTLSLLKSVSNPESTRLESIWNILPEGEFQHKLPPDQNGVQMYEICGRKFGERVLVQYMIDTLEQFYKSYGERALQAANNEGIDWKAISHAFRAAYQVESILRYGTIIFPLPEADFLRRIKQGEYDYQSFISPKLNELISRVEELSEQSILPKHVDTKFWNQFIIDVMEEELTYDFH